MTQRKSRGKSKRVSAATRASDDELRERLRTADLKKFDRALGRAIAPPK